VKIRHPRGRAGRPWLARRLAVARRGAELLDEKVRALLRERRRLAPLAEAARREWEQAAPEAERWLTRAAVLGGERELDIARRPSQPADVRVEWRTLLGVACPVEVEVAPAAAAAPVAGAALLSARGAHEAALEAAARVAVFDGALRRIDAELRATSLRRNAVQHRWIPAHEEALAALELALEEVEREDGVRVRWAAGRGA
jgi:V/A-type H+-transporting ATPase subunit D